MDTMHAMNDETVKKKVQIAVLSLTLNRSLQDQRRLKTKVNNCIQVIESHDKVLQKVKRNQKMSGKGLHFAFMFASPIVF